MSSALPKSRNDDAERPSRVSSSVMAWSSLFKTPRPPSPWGLEGSMRIRVLDVIMVSSLGSGYVAKVSRRLRLDEQSVRVRDSSSAPNVDIGDTSVHQLIDRVVSLVPGTSADDQPDRKSGSAVEVVLDQLVDQFGYV